MWDLFPRLIILIWFLSACALGAVGIYIGFRTTLPGPASPEALERNDGERIAAAHGIPRRDRVAVLLRNTKSLTGSDSFAAARESLFETLKNLPGSNGAPVFTKLITFGHTPLEELNNSFVSDDKHTLLLIGTTTALLQNSAQENDYLRNALLDWQKLFPDFSVKYISHGAVDHEILSLIEKDLDQSLIYTVPLTLLILWWAFGSFRAASIPLGIGIVSLVASLGAAALYSHLVGPISATASQLVVLLVLAIGVEYSLFMLSRVREEKTRGLGHNNAVLVARRCTGTAILWSGLTVALSLIGLLLMQDTILTSMAVVSIIAVIITVSGTVWVLPSLLLIAESASASKPSKSSVSALLPLVQLSIRRPGLVLLAITVLLLLTSAPVRHMLIGSTMELHIVPQSMQSAQAFHLLHDGFPESSGVRFSLVLHGDNLQNRESDGALDSFLDALNDFPQVRGPLRSEWSDDGQVVRLEFSASGTANDPENHQLLHRIREDLIPKFLSPQEIAAHPTDHLVYVVDEAERYLSRTPMVIAAVLACSFVFLLVAFRSAIIPLKAVLLNLLSTGASFGSLVICFQWGFLPPWHFGVVESFVPALLFAVLFGLSMDYHVFLLSRIREESRNGKSTAEAVEIGLISTSRTITSAALIMASVFAIIATLQLPVMKQLGLGLAVAVLLDATLIRSLLLPASMVLLGKWNWYLPRWLRWIPDIKVH